ncbi:phosphatidate cytidylyltransferase [Bradyrhizobium sp.]|uniref:phosphatidate cytidylyltransferase n=1 Tax=Bradyrhizobium sp. TaxID=376 RepID=UPI003C67418D
MTESESASKTAAGQEGRNLLSRIVAALVMAPLAIAIAYAGGWLWTGLVTAAAIGLYVEWLAVIGMRTLHLVVLGVLILLGVGLVDAGHITATYVFGLAALGILAVAIVSSDRRGWAAIGIAYALAASIASSAVRLDPAWGFTALMLVLLAVWATDIGGYFAGRLIGGPKLWPRVSPKKTWAGAIGGFVASLGVAGGFAAAGLGTAAPLLGLGAILSIASQIGDLFESAVKRRFGVKDSSHIIPGHGGLMDRLDGFVAAIVLAAIFGFLRGGADGVGRGLMVW